MSKSGYKILLILLFIFNVGNGYARQDSLFLYTKPGCSTCKSVKLVLHQSGIYYIEKSLDKSVFSNEMLHKLASAGYHDQILLPVIFLNNKLFHPAYKNDTGLVVLSISDVVDSIKSKFRRGELNLQSMNPKNTTELTETSAANSDCELKATPIYLICENYTTEADAKVAMNKLITNGYTYAGIAYSQNNYRVFCKILYDRTAAEKDLNQIRKLYPNAYLFETP